MTIKEIRQSTGLSQSKFAEKFNIPVTNLQLWEQGVNNPLKYVVYMIEKILLLESELNELKGAQRNEEINTSRGGRNKD